MKVPYLSFTPANEQIRDAMHRAFARVYDSQEYILGREVAGFERAWAVYCGTSRCIGVSNGLDALRLGLELVGVGPGDEVIVPSNTYIATVLAVSQTGAVPVFAEPDILTYNIDPSGIEAALSPKTRAVIPVHLYGQACVMDEIADIAARRNLWIIEDNAQAHGASYKGKRTGSWGTINAASFFPTKNLGALGDAGALTTDDARLAERAALLRNYGSKEKYFNEVRGYNMRLDELQAALLSVKLDRLDEWNQERIHIAGQYTQHLAGIGDLCLPVTASGAGHVYHIYMIRTQTRDALRDHLQRAGIGTHIHYPVPPHLQKAYAGLGYKKGRFPIAEAIADTCLSLPVWPGMTGEDVRTVTSAIKDFYS